MQLKYFLLFIVFLFGIQQFACTSSVRFGSNSPHPAVFPTFSLDQSDSTSFETSQGKASWYGKKFHGKKTASGEVFNLYDFTAAHKTYPFGTIVKVTTLKNNLSAIVKINDRMPFRNKRIIDLSYAAAKALKILKSGVTNVKVEVLKWGK